MIEDGNINISPRREPFKDVNSRRIVYKDRSDRLVEKDVSKLEYRLERDRDYRYWYVLFKTEMCLKKLVDIIDSSVAPWQRFTMQEMAERKTIVCLLYTSPSPRDRTRSRMPSSA